MPRNALSIVVPCYNEEANIDPLVIRFRDVIPASGDTEVLFVNNGSTDQTARRLETAIARVGFGRQVNVEKNRGYGFGIMQGVRAAVGDVIAWTHADMQTDPGDVLDAFATFEAHGDPRSCVLKGRRRNRAALDGFFTWGMSVISSMALGVRLDDVNAQPKMFHRSFLEYMSHPPDDFSLDLYFLYMARKRGLQILEHPVDFSRRLHSEAKGGGTLRGKIKLICQTCSYTVKLRREIAS